MIDAEIAQTLLTGIVASTDRFTATHTTAKALTVAAQMMAAGADHQQVIRGLYRDRSSAVATDRAPKRTDRSERTDRPASKTDRPTQTDSRPVVREAAPTTPAVPVAAVVEAAPVAPAPIKDEVVKADDSLAPTPLDESRPDIVATPTAQPIAAMPLPTPETSAIHPIIDNDGPMVTDPDDSMEDSSRPRNDRLVVVAPLDGEMEPEPLINSQDEPRPKPAPPAPKAANPTNKPVFANRLSR